MSATTLTLVLAYVYSFTHSSAPVTDLIPPGDGPPVGGGVQELKKTIPSGSGLGVPHPVLIR